MSLTAKSDNVPADGGVKSTFSIFLKRPVEGGTDPTTAKGEIQSSVEAYQALGLEFGSPMSAVTRAFRQQVKKTHPDIRNDDRSAEPQLRRIIEAYQYSKNDFSTSYSEPPSPPAGY